MLANVATEVGSLGIEIADVAGYIDELTGNLKSQVSHFGAVRSATEELTMANAAVATVAGRNEQAFLVQTYRRDMGGGQYALMKDVSAPITVGGRHWGGLRLAYNI